MPEFPTRLTEYTIEAWEAYYTRLLGNWEDSHWEDRLKDYHLGNCCGTCDDAERVLRAIKTKKLNPEFSLEEVMPTPTSQDVTHFEMEMKKTPEGTTIFLKSPFVEALMKKLSNNQMRDYTVGRGWPNYRDEDQTGVMRGYRIPNPPMYITGITNNWQYYMYPIVFNGFNPSVLTLVGLKDGLTFKVHEPMSCEAQDVFSEMIGSCIKQLIEGFAGTTSKRSVKIVGGPLSPTVETRMRTSRPRDDR
jgi:hypothetical protein